MQTHMQHELETTTEERLGEQRRITKGTNKFKLTNSVGQVA